MNLDETTKIMTFISMNFTEVLLPSGWKTDKKYAIECWHTMIGDLAFDDVKKAVVAHITADGKYPPTISDIRSRVVAMNTVDNIIPVEQAWGSIIEAIGKFGYMREIEALNSLTGACRQIVECFTWKYYCEMPTPQTATYYAQFRNSYTARTSYEREQRQLPEHLRAHKADRLEAQTGSNFEKRVYSIDQFEDLAEDFGVRE